MSSSILILLFAISLFSIGISDVSAEGFNQSALINEATNASVVIPSAADTNQMNSILKTVMIGVLGFIGTLSVLVIVIAGIMYITAGGDEDRIENAKRWLLYAIIGLAIALLGWVIVVSIEMLLKN